MKIGGTKTINIGRGALLAAAGSLYMMLGSTADELNKTSGPKGNLVKPKPPLSETKQLTNNDNLIPTQNRTQAMRIEAESGHLPAQESQMLKPTKHVDPKTNSKSAFPKASTKKNGSGHVSHRGNSNRYAFMRRTILDAANNR